MVRNIKYGGEFSCKSGMNHPPKIFHSFMLENVVAGMWGYGDPWLGPERIRPSQYVLRQGTVLGTNNDISQRVLDSVNMENTSDTFEQEMGLRGRRKQVAAHRTVASTMT